MDSRPYIALVFGLMLTSACVSPEEGGADDDVIATQWNPDEESNETEEDTTEEQEEDEPLVAEGLTIPYELEALPSDTTTPWPGDGTLTHGAYVEVTHVTDGDTVFVSTGPDRYERERVRIVGINAPECEKRDLPNGLWECDPDHEGLEGTHEIYGAEAHAELERLVEGEAVRIACKEVTGRCETDRYGRALAFLVVDEDVDVSRHMAETGYAWAYTQFPTENIYTYCVAEDAAIESGSGMWTAGFDQVVLGMNSQTRNWYSYRDSTCEEARPE